MSDVSIFISYAHLDNDAAYGRIKEMSDSVGRVYSALTGKNATVFFDVDSISLGERWRDRIRSGLSAATILLAFVSPIYMKRPECRAELREFLSFLSQGGSSRLIIPLLLVARAQMDGLLLDDDLWGDVVELQYLAIDEMWFEDPGTGAWLKKVHVIAKRVDEKLSEQAEKGSAITPEIPKGESQSATGDRVGKFELISRVETEAPVLMAEAQKFAVLIENFGSTVTSVAPEIARAESFGQRLAASQRLASQLTPITDQSLEVSEVMIKVVTSMDPGVVAAIRLAKNAPDAGTSEVQNFLQVIGDMANSIITAMSQLTVLEASIEQGKGYSSDLDQPLDTMQRSLLLVAEMNAIAQGWLDELGDLESSVE